MIVEQQNIRRGLILLVCMTAIGVWFGWIWASGLLMSEAIAAWVQAVGSIVAILVAMRLSVVQAEQADAREKERTRFEVERIRLERRTAIATSVAMARVALRRTQAVYEAANHAEHHVWLSLPTMTTHLKQIQASMLGFDFGRLGDMRAIDAHIEIAAQIDFVTDALQRIPPEKTFRELPEDKISNSIGQFKIAVDYLTTRIHLLDEVAQSI